MTQYSSYLCQYREQCSGCSLWHLNLLEQLNYKKEKMSLLLIEKGIAKGIDIQILGVDSLKYRDRIDVSFVNGKLGFFGKNNVEKNIIDIVDCLILSDSLRIFFYEFRSHLLNYKVAFTDYKISFRLRVGPHGDRGLWIDTSHSIIKELLDEKTFLLGLINRGVVIEIGQKLKPLALSEKQELKLQKEKIPKPWISTFSQDFEQFDIFSEVGAFTQPGIVSNKLLISEVHSIISKIEDLNGKFKNVIELFSGNGNFTLAFLSRGLKVHSYENHLGAQKNLELSLDKYPQFKENINFFRINLYGGGIKDAVKFSEDSLLFVDPPRSGLSKVMDLLELQPFHNLPIHFLYVSCEARSLVEDLARLINLGYEIQLLKGIDQFIYSEHSEWICLLKKSSKK